MGMDRKECYCRKFLATPLTEVHSICVGVKVTRRHGNVCSVRLLSHTVTTQTVLTHTYYAPRRTGGGAFSDPLRPSVSPTWAS